ncbi:hypothetical protein D918_09093 [Trichuris suis]|nr:hypothetical protein D918_09093 [Trichuris suis]
MPNRKCDKNSCDIDGRCDNLAEEVLHLTINNV